MKNKILKRLQSKGVWIGVLAQVVLVAGMHPTTFEDGIKIVGLAIIEAATLFGFLNNPDSTKEF